MKPVFFKSFSILVVAAISSGLLYFRAQRPGTLAEAIQQGDLQYVSSCLTAGGDVESVDKKGNTLLLQAIRAKQPALAKMLIDQGAHLAVTNQLQMTPLLSVIAMDLDSVLDKFEMTPETINQLRPNGLNLLKFACLNGSTKSIDWLIENGAEINEATRMSALHCAIAGDTECLAALQRLLFYKADLNVVDAQGRTALFYAAPQEARILIEHGANINVRDRDGYSAMIRAYCIGKMELVRLLFDAQADCSGNPCKLTPLILAAAIGDLEYIKAHAPDEGFNAHAMNCEITPLTVALTHQQYAVSAYLIEQKTRFSDEEKIAVLALGPADLVDQFLLKIPLGEQDRGQLDIACRYAICRENFDQARKLMGLGAHLTGRSGNKVLIDAAIGNHVDILQFLLEHGVPLDRPGPGDRTALSFAADAGAAEAVALLLKNGADPSLQDDVQLTALSYAVKGCEYDCTKLLLEYGADLNDPTQCTLALCCLFEKDTRLLQLLIDHEADLELADDYGHTSLLAAIRGGHIEKTELLLRHHADPRKENNEGANAGMLAIFSNQLPLLELLVERNLIEVNRKNSRGTTLLSHAARYDRLEMIQWLLDHGAQVINEFDDDGLNALFYAAANGDVKTATLLHRCGAALDILSPVKGVTPLMVAAQAGQREMVQYLIDQGANIDTLSTVGKPYTALDFALRAGQTEIVNLLKNITAAKS